MMSWQNITKKKGVEFENQQPNYTLMETFISAIPKLVIKDVVLYADNKIEATKSVIN